MPSTHIVVDLGFGDAGKGTMVDAIARRCSSPPLVVRHNGGAQAGHNVVTSDGMQHVFSQFGAATFVPGSRTLLSQHFILHPAGLVAENAHLRMVGVSDALDRLAIEERALVITPYHQAMNRLREYARGTERHGTCGLGIGETVEDSETRLDELTVRARDLTNVRMLRLKLKKIQEYKQFQVQTLIKSLDEEEVASTLGLLHASSAHLAEHLVEIGQTLHIVSPEQAYCAIQESEHMIFEGSQGVLLDEWHGFHPHTTWSTTTSKNALGLIADAKRAGPVKTIGVLRAYATRHGQGPFPTENAALSKALPDTHNVSTGWQGQFRVGWFDAPLTRYALSVCPVDELAVTCLDRLADVPLGMKWQICDSYKYPDDKSKHLLCPLARPPGDLAYQESLTRDLERFAPVLRAAPDDPLSYAREIEAVLNLPVAVMSMGPTAEAKRWGRP